jgi:hypothetical protein
MADMSRGAVVRQCVLGFVSANIGFRDVLEHHALRVEKGAVECDSVSHDVDEARAVAIEERGIRSRQATAATSDA